MLADGNENNWISFFVSDYKSNNDGREPRGLEVYVAALYWSVMTLTSIGCAMPNF